jgi:hypothetical protein
MWRENETLHREPAMMSRDGRTWVLATAVLLAVSACSGGFSIESTTETGFTTDAPQVTTTTPPAGNDSSWGPLAVVRGGNGMDALIEGTIRITDDCVLLDERGELVLLVWPADRTLWDEDSAAIRFNDPNGGVTTIVDGQPVRLGGGGTSVDEGGLGAEEWRNSIEWISAPPSSCVTDTRWSVSGVLN